MDIIRKCVHEIENPITNIIFIKSWNIFLHDLDELNAGNALGNIKKNVYEFLLLLH